MNNHHLSLELCHVEFSIIFPLYSFLFCNVFLIIIILSLKKLCSVSFLWDLPLFWSLWFFCTRLGTLFSGLAIKLSSWNFSCLLCWSSRSTVSRFHVFFSWLTFSHFAWVKWFYASKILKKCQGVIHFLSSNFLKKKEIYIYICVCVCVCVCVCIYIYIYMYSQTTMGLNLGLNT